jgi:hypothetical protein
MPRVCINRQLFLTENFVTVNVRHRHLRGGRQVHFFIAQPVHVLFELRQLARADHGIAVDEKRRKDFRVTVLARVQVEQEINQGPFQTRARALVENKSAAGNLRRSRKIQDTKLFANLPMCFRLKRKLRRFTPAFHLGIVRRILPHRDTFMR